MKKSRFILGIFALLVIITLPTTTVKAGPGVPPYVHLSFCGTQFYFGIDDFPSHFYDNFDIYDTNGTLVERIVVTGRNAETVDVGYAIGRVVAHWGEPGWPPNSEFWITKPTCTSVKLIDMYVYYSVNPFFGDTHTLTIYSSQGFPSKAVVTALAGGKLPEGFAYGAPSCWGALFDDGTDQGRFDCDSFLAGVGERRAYLRNDPEGSAFDLLPKINAYLEMLKAKE